MTLVEMLLIEALSPELSAALAAAGHTGKEAHVSRAHKDDPSESIAILHDNPRAMTDKDYGYKEGKYRITFIDKEERYNPKTNDSYFPGPSEPSGHISYHNPEDAVRHLGTIKQLHAVGAPNSILGHYFSTNMDDFNYKKRTPKQKAAGLADLADAAPPEAYSTIDKIAGEEMRRDRADLRAKHNPLGLDMEEYKQTVLDVANQLTEDAVYSAWQESPYRQETVDSVPQLGIEEAKPRKLSYRRLAQIASAMGAATSAGT